MYKESKKSIYRNGSVLKVYFYYNKGNKAFQKEENVTEGIQTGLNDF